MEQLRWAERTTSNRRKVWCIGLGRAILLSFGVFLVFFFCVFLGVFCFFVLFGGVFLFVFPRADIFIGWQHTPQVGR